MIEPETSPPSQNPRTLWLSLALMLAVTILGSGLLFVVQNHTGNPPSSTPLIQPSIKVQPSVSVQPSPSGPSFVIFTPSPTPEATPTLGATPTPASSQPITVEQIAYNPATISCASPVDFSETFFLSGAIQSGEKVTLKLDGVTLATYTVGATSSFLLSADDRWELGWLLTPAEILGACQNNGNHLLAETSFTQGAHLTQIYNTSGVLLSQGSYTIAP